MVVRAGIVCGCRGAVVVLDRNRGQERQQGPLSSRVSWIARAKRMTGTVTGASYSVSPKIRAEGCSLGFGVKLALGPIDSYSIWLI